MVSNTTCIYTQNIMSVEPSGNVTDDVVLAAQSRHCRQDTYI